MRRLLLVIAALPVSPAGAHDWFTGKRDPITGYECCGNKDCRVISPNHVEPLPGGDFNLRIGSKARYFIPKDRVLESEDGQYHICSSAPHITIRCFFAPHIEARATGNDPRWDTW